MQELYEVVHKKPDSDHLEVRPSTEGVTSTPPPGLEHHPPGSGEEHRGRMRSPNQIIVYFIIITS